MATLPSSFTSLYRLFWRTSSASVLHHPAARIALRQSWRPVFEEALSVIHKQQSIPASNVMERKALEDWLIKWEGQMDNTLSLLYTAASSRGLPHDVIRNFASLQRRHVGWANFKYNRPAAAWNPKLSPSEYQVKPMTKSAQALKNQSGSQLDERAWDALGEVVQMAERRSGLILGRMNWKNKQRSRWEY